MQSVASTKAGSVLDDPGTKIADSNGATTAGSSSRSHLPATAAPGEPSLLPSYLPTHYRVLDVDNQFMEISMNVLARCQQPAFPWADQESVNHLANRMLTILVDFPAATLRYILCRPPPYRAPSNLNVAAHGLIDTSRAACKTPWTSPYGLSRLPSPAGLRHLLSATTASSLSRTANPVVRMQPHGKTRAAPLRLVGVTRRASVITVLLCIPQPRPGSD